MLPGWMPDERQLGYDVMNIGGGQRILAHAIEQKLTLTSSGAYEMLTEGSTKPLRVKRKCRAQFEVYRV